MLPGLRPEQVGLATGLLNYTRYRSSLLFQVDLAENHIGTGGVAALITALEANRSLTVLNVGGGGSSEQGPRRGESWIDPGLRDAMGILLQENAELLERLRFEVRVVSI